MQPPPLFFDHVDESARLTNNSTTHNFAPLGKASCAVRSAAAWSPPEGGKPVPAQGLISHVVIIVKENHTFDNYFGTFPGANGDSKLARAADPPPFDPPHNHKAWLDRAAGAVHHSRLLCLRAAVYSLR